ncbi:uncharacterized protein LACBIDRAFT_314434 [Laccaria bicolor S238N-H82]|uniref:Kinetochore protein SPC25 n=1 Tax=Laccaria bicolor (strain S238N-H82 / ATCC MYA-4686) TaxID=486041 RepID=B0DYJ5_LACBS|nr:uncharacterized protein LACBIDRAFT_314434 [Laccaria bicolor S238N-H82]EDR00256.1 predicted protein [Laccaria bicolor S238N-H82]|eukprot:XP_001889008.1 predicted protein [Laccaria bicolor S238N-H82]
MPHVLRLPQIDLASVLAEQNPHIELRTHIYENSTRNFLKALITYKNRAIATISDRRKHQAMEKKKVAERVNLVETETNQCKLREIELVADLERENEERKDAELSIAAFNRQLASLRDNCVSIETEIEQYRAISDNLRRAKNKEQSLLHTHASKVLPELNFCEQRLSCVIEGVERDQLLVRFARLQPSDQNCEASFVIDVSNKTYRIITSSPHLPILPILVNALNETGDVYAFVRQVRDQYLELFSVL